MTRDTVNVQRGVTSAGADFDTYVLAAPLVDAGATITISDGGANAIQLIGGLEIIASQVANTALLLTLSNGATVTILDAQNYTFETGGNPLFGTPGVERGFAAFAQDALGVAVPGAGIVAGGGATINEDGSVLRGGDDNPKETPPTEFDGDDGKVGTNPRDVLHKGSPAKSSGDFGALTLEAADAMGLAALRADPRFAGADGEGFAVAVIDTGIDLDHPAFGRVVNGQSERILRALDFTPETDGPDDREGHGSNVASIIASSDAAYPGVAPAAGIVSLQALGNDGSGWNSDIEQALRWVIDNAAAHDIVAVNLSLGNGSNVNQPGPAPGGYADELAALRQMGVVVIAAAGNDYYAYQTPGTSDLAADPNVLSIGAVWDDAFRDVFWGDGAKDFVTVPGQITSFSQRATASAIDTLFAPGAFIVGAAPGGGTSSLGGTSQAAPHVAGLVALAQDIAEDTLGRRLSPAEFEEVLRAGAIQVQDRETANDNVVNTGATFDGVNALAMAEAILALAGDPGGGEEPPAGGGDDGSDEGDPDAIPGDASTPETLAVGSSRESTVDFERDTDWFRVSLDAGVAYEMALQGSASMAGTLADPLLNLVDASGRIVATDDDGGRGRDALLLVSAPADGDYFVEARAYGSETGSYRVSVTRTGPADDFPADSSTPSVLAAGASLTGELETLGDHDWHRLDLRAGETHVVSLSGRSSGLGTLEDPYLRVYAADGSLIGANDDADGLDSALALTVSAAQSVYVDAGAFGDAGTGTYTLAVERLAGSGDVPGDSSTTAALQSGQPVQGELESVNDTDWYRVTFTAGMRYDIDMLGAPSGAGDLRDPFLRLHDASGEQLAFDDDGGAGLEARLSYRAEASGTHYVSAGSYAGIGTGSYTLLLAESGGAGGGDIPDDVSTSAMIQPGQVIAGSLEQRGDADWFATTLVANTTYLFSLGGVGSGSGTLVDPLLRLHDAAGREVTSDDDGGPALDAALSFVPAIGGVYYVSAESFARRHEGTYELAMAIGEGGVADRVGDGPDTQASLRPGEAIDGTLEFAGDDDWYRVPLIAGTEYAFGLRGASSAGGTLRDPLLRLHDAAGQQLAADDDGGVGLDSALSYVPTYTGDHYLSARSYADYLSGSYTLTAAVSGDAQSNLAVDLEGWA